MYIGKILKYASLSYIFPSYEICLEFESLIILLFMLSFYEVIVSEAEIFYFFALRMWHVVSE